MGKREEIPPSTLVSDLKALLHHAGEPGGLGDVVFKVEDREVVAHKALCMRCAYFKTLLTGNTRLSCHFIPHYLLLFFSKTDHSF
jgi:hypothetical protein